MSAVKTNERPGTRAQIKYVRSSASKAREVLNLIRLKSYDEATDLLTFSERRISDTIQKCVNSAAANAENNDGISSEELYISSCYADEGPTLKRWRPRARGRATRINKRTCHITIILARYTPDEIDEMRARAALKGSAAAPNSAEARRKRVEKSKESSKDEQEEALEVEQEADDVAVDIDDVEESSPYGTGSVLALEDGSSPSDDYGIKAKAGSKIYHPPESPFYSRTKADVWFTTSETAEEAGFNLPASMQGSAEDGPSSGDDNKETGEENETEEGQ
jgi:large subunit ribosomal protein L22